MAKARHQAHRLRAISWCVEPVGDGRFCLAPLLWACSYRTCDYTITARKRYGKRHSHFWPKHPNMHRLARRVFADFLAVPR